MFEIFLTSYSFPAAIAPQALPASSLELSLLEATQTDLYHRMNTPTSATIKVLSRLAKPMSEQTSAFQSAIDAVRVLSFEDQEALLTLLQKRLAEQRRDALSQNVAEVRDEFVQGNVTFGSVDDFIAGLED